MSTAEEHAARAHHRGVAAGNAGHPAVGARLVRDGLAALGWHDGDRAASPAAGTRSGPAPPGDRGRAGALPARMLITLAYLEAEQGHAEYGLRLLEAAEPAVAAADRGHLHSQRGLMLMRTGRWADALAQLAVAEPLAAGQPELRARILLNRSAIYLNTGGIRLAREALRRLVAIAGEAGLTLLAAKATQNLGYCDLLDGDIPAALHQFDRAAQAYEANAPGMLPVLATDRARALLAAGLAADAALALDSAIAAFRRQRLDQNLGEAELNRAQAAQAAGDPVAARRWAALARRRFLARENHAWAALAELARLQAAFDAGQGTGRGHARTAAAASQAAGRLRVHGLPRDAALAELLAARAFAAAGRPADAARCLAAAGGRDLPLDALLLRRLARAELAAADARAGQALTELRAGLAVLHTRRGQLGSLDLQTGTAALGAELARLGLRLVLDRGSPRSVYGWLERSRAQSFRVRPVRPPADPAAAAVLAELRHLGFQIRAGELSGGQPDPARLARRAELQRQVRQRSWQADGPGQLRAVADASEVAAALGASGQQLVSLAVHDGQMLAVTIAGGRVRLTRLGDFTRVAEAARRLAADLDVLAGRRLATRLAAVIRESVSRQAEVLDREVLGPLRPLLGPDARHGLVIVPVGALSAVPWGMLPSLRGQPVTVCPSASTWLASWQASWQAAAGRGEPRPVAGAGPLLVAGPGLRHAEPEVTEIAAAYPGARPLTGAAATVEATLRALDGAPLAHLAAHGHHDQDNVLFSRLDLADGPLMAYDIQRLADPPRQVVLSACDVGRTVVRPGDEILGFTAALLHIGTPTVISSVCRVADDVAFRVMTAYHRALASGARPARALAAAASGASDEPLTPFVCFGAG